jgi:hypothetical protein
MYNYYQNLIDYFTQKLNKQKLLTDCEFKQFNDTIMTLVLKHTKAMTNVDEQITLQLLEANIQPNL